MVGIFKNGCGNLAKEQRFAGRPANAHNDQIVVPEAGLPQDSIFGGDIEA